MSEGQSPSEETNPFEPPKADPPRQKLDLLSLHRFEFRSELSRRKAMRRLGESVGRTRWFRFAWQTPPFPLEGEMTDDSFKIRRAQRGRKAFVLVIRGAIDRHPRGGSRIRGSMTPHPSTLLFFAVWTALLLVGAFRKTDNTIGPLVMLAGGWAIGTVAFFAEVRKARALLVEIFEVSGPEDGA